MCGRFYQYSSPVEIAAQLPTVGCSEFPIDCINYNASPGQIILALNTGTPPQFSRCLWGYRPPHAGPKAPMPINARAETIATSAWFAEAFKHRRILIPVDGWFEWTKTTTGKQPYRVYNRDNSIQFLAALATPSAEGEYQRCAIITEPARGRLAHLHHRQPLMLDRSSLLDWLNPNLTDRLSLKRCIQRQKAEVLAVDPISSRVNKVANNNSSLLTPITSATN